MFSIGTDLKLQGLQRRSNSYFEVRLGNASTSDCNLEVFSELLATAELEDVPEATQPQEVAEVSTSPTSQEVPPNDNPTTELPDDSENPENITLLRWNQIISTLSLIFTFFLIFKKKKYIYAIHKLKTISELSSLSARIQIQIGIEIV